MESAKVEKIDKAEALKPMVLDANTQQIMARDNSELVRIIRILMKGSALPASLKTEEQVIAAWQMASSLRIPPAVAIQNMAVINGTIAIWGQLPKGLADATGELNEFKLILFDDAQKVISLENKNLGAPVWGAVTQMRRNKRSLNEYSFTEPEAKTAGLLTKAGPWQAYRKIMYARRTTGHAVKFEFPDAVMGVGIAEYDFHEAPDLRDVTPVSSNGKADEIRAKIFGGADELKY